MGEGSRGRLLSLLGRGKKGQTTEVLSLWEREAGADYRSTVLMGKGSRGRLQKYCPYGEGEKGQTIEVLSPWEREAGADYRSTVLMGKGRRGRL